MGGLTSYILSYENPELYSGTIMMAPALTNPLNFFASFLINSLGSIFPNLTVM
jgi:hypothetical protein